MNRIVPRYLMHIDGHSMKNWKCLLPSTENKLALI
uniref:Uncharacterized protein n=1 Tax=Arundo donax TaxID=35708 RepID=A0A0A9C8E0_ARUDO